MTRTKKRLTLCVAASLFSALSTRIWTDNRAELQMAAYSGLVLGMLWIGFGEDRRRRRFPPAVLLVLAIHASTLALGRSLFPVNTTILLWPAAGLEGTLLGLLLVWVLGKWREPLPPHRRSWSSSAGGRVER